MPIDAYELVDRFGAATEAGAAGLLVGAGLSKAAHLPDWDELMEFPRTRIDIPAAVRDLPLVAEYYEQDPHGGRASLKQHLLTSTCPPGAAPGDGHRLLAELPVREIWTTNYDPLIEQAVPDCRVVATEEDTRLVGDGRSVVKMHGSIAPGPPPTWTSEPVVSRSDYERYATDRPRMWALLRASYLTRTFLFLGFSFADPNVEVLLRLARANGTATTDRHLTVLRKPTDPVDLRLHDLRVRDLEASGIAVHEVGSHGALVPLLAALVRRTRPPRLFVAGSGDRDDVLPWAERLAGALAAVGQPDWELASLGGEAGWLTTRELARLRRAAGEYDPARLMLFFRRKDEPVPALDERAGTAVFTDMTRDELYPDVMARCRAVLVVGGGTRTSEEVAWARRSGLGVVPLAASGGAALQAWQDHAGGNPPLLGGRPAATRDWQMLADTGTGVAVQAAVRLLRQALYRLPS